MRLRHGGPDKAASNLKEGHDIIEFVHRSLKLQDHGSLLCSWDKNLRSTRLGIVSDNLKPIGTFGPKRIFFCSVATNAPCF